MLNLTPAILALRADFKAAQGYYQNRARPADKQNKMEHTPRVLVIEDDPEYAQLITTVLEGCGSPFEVEAGVSLADGLDTLLRFQPDVILLDLDLPDSSGYSTFLRVRGRSGGVPILVLTGLDDDDIAVKTAEDGAQEYLVKGLLQPKLITRYVKMALSRPRPHPAAPQAPTQVIGFIGSKGGVGTSTIAVNAAAHLAQSGCDTLVIEFQPGPGTLSTYLAAKPTHGLNSLLQIPAAKLTERDVQPALMTAGPNLCILCPGTPQNPSIHANAHYAQAIIHAARQMCTYVLLDLPARLDNGVAAALRLCDSIAVIVDREASSVSSAVEMLEYIEATASQESHVLLVAVDRTNPKVPVPLTDILARLKMHPGFAVPRASGLALSHSARTPLAWLSPEDRFSLAILELTEQLVATSPGFPERVTTRRSALAIGDSRLVVSEDYLG